METRRSKHGGLSPISDLYFDETNSTVSPIFLPTTRGKSPFFLRRYRMKSSSPNLFLVPCAGLGSFRNKSIPSLALYTTSSAPWDWNSSRIFYFLLFNLLSRFFFIFFVFSTDSNFNSRQWEQQGWNFPGKKFDISTCFYFVGSNTSKKIFSIYGFFNWW